MEEVDLPPDIRWQLTDEKKQQQTGPSSVESRFRGSLIPVAFPMSNASSTDSLDLLLEKQRQRQLNHPLHQNHITTTLSSTLNREQQLTYNRVKETNTVSLEYDPISKRKVLNTYEIIEELGHGQHGKVKLARDLVTKKLVAIKIVNRHKKRSFKDRLSNKLKTPQSGIEDEKIKREIAIMKKCHHEHVVKLIEVLDDAKSRKIYLVLEYCSKGEIKWCPGDIIETKARGPPLLSFQRTREIFRGVLLGLEYLHFQGIIHRDIKPANLLLSGDGTVKISDFGVSLAFSSENSTDSLNELELAKTAGTPAFLAPEICLVEDTITKFNLDPNSKEPIISYPIDVWALGITLHCLLFGKLPFISEYEMELFDKIVNEPLSFDSYLHIRQNTVSKIESEKEYHEVQDLLNLLLEKNPKKRMSIQDAKNHPWVCWDFDQTIKDPEDEKAFKLPEKMNFQRSPYEEVEQICISEHELDTAVGGIGHKIKNKTGSRFSASQSQNDSKTNTMKDGLKNPHESSYLDENLKSCFSCTDNGNLILSEEAVSSQPNPKNNNNIINTLEAHRANTPIHDISAREIFQRELQRFDDKSDPNLIVSLPVNSSFASLDSFYIDHYASKNMSENSSQGPHNQQSKYDGFERPTVGSFSKPNSNGRVPTQNSFRIPSPSGLHIDTLSMGSGISGRIARNNVHSPIMSPTGPHSRRTSNDFPNAALGSRLRKPAPIQCYDKHHDNISNPRTSYDNPNRKIASHLHQNTLRKPSIIFDGLQESDGDSQSTTSHRDESNVYQMGSESEDDDIVDNCFYLSDNHSDAESLPFEFGLDSEHGSVLSLRDLTKVPRNGGNSYTEVRSAKNFSEPPENSKLYSKGTVNAPVQKTDLSSTSVNLPATSLPTLSGDYIDAFTDVEEVPEEMLNMIPEMQTESIDSFSRNADNSNQLFHPFSSHVLPTTQASSVDHVITMNKSTQAKNFLQSVLSSKKTSRTNSYGSIHAPVQNSGATNSLANETFVNHYSGSKDMLSNPIGEEISSSNENCGRYRSKSISVAFLADKDAENSH
ncbi:unnamed protein product [Kluyveromyces dobzhanskii CBS 2104]|uniref:non-specific serine/threonine protein kinase n=1 Tax=Kluyveromyces dobzhanskii CBS 2104 TaxID=1427455 RepID=A0A0A8L632_9SACH|nr:unnamed protein product [Kluyveromyces dobzhanskii CBS 2104]